MKKTILMLTIFGAINSVVCYANEGVLPLSGAGNSITYSAMIKNSGTVKLLEPRYMDQGKALTFYGVVGSYEGLCKYIGFGDTKSYEVSYPDNPNMSIKVDQVYFSQFSEIMIWNNPYWSRLSSITCACATDECEK